MRPKSRIKNKNKKSSKNIFVALALGLLVLSFYFFINLNKIGGSVNSKKIEEKSISVKSLGDIRLTPSLTPTLTPAPTLIPTSTPAPLVGYCLNVPVLMYHHIQPEARAQILGQKALSVDNGEFDLQMGYLVSQGYSIISAKQLADALINHTGLPQKSAVITIDDGYSDIYSYAYPILQKYHLIANLMIPTGLLGGADYLSWGQLEEMVRSGLIFVGDHTWSHYSITRGSLDKIKFEIQTGKQQLQDHTGQNIDLFTYPYGEFNANAISILRSEGFVGAFSEIGGFWQCDSFIMTLHRTRIGNAPLSAYGL